MTTVKKNILVITPSLEHIGGGITLSNSISDILKSTHNVYQTSFDQAGAARSFDSNTPFYALGGRHNKFLRSTKLVTRILLVYRLRKLKRMLKIELSISVLWEADLINLISGGADKKVSLLVSNFHDNPLNRHMVRYSRIFGSIYRKFHMVLAINNPVRKELSELFKIKASRLGVFRNFLAMPHPVPVWTRDQTRRYIFCGRLAPEKNLEGLLYVWVDFCVGHPNTQLIVLGDGPLANSSQKLAVDLGLKVGYEPHDVVSDILFLGMVSRPEDYIVNAHALLLPSKNEGTPTVVIIALLLGVPIVAADSNSGCIRDMLGGQNLGGDADSVEVDAGLLLPIPDIQKESSISTWVRQLSNFDSDTYKWDQRALSAKELSETFSVQSAKNEWTNLIERGFNSAVQS